jgi:hypothetical protein
MFVKIKKVNTLSLLLAIALLFSCLGKQKKTGDLINQDRAQSTANKIKLPEPLKLFELYIEDYEEPIYIPGSCDKKTQTCTTPLGEIAYPSQARTKLGLLTVLPKTLLDALKSDAPFVDAGAVRKLESIEARTKALKEKKATLEGKAEPGRVDALVKTRAADEAEFKSTLGADADADSKYLDFKVKKALIDNFEAKLDVDLAGFEAAGGNNLFGSLSEDGIDLGFINRNRDEVKELMGIAKSDMDAIDYALNTLEEAIKTVPERKGSMPLRGRGRKGSVLLPERQTILSANLEDLKRILKDHKEAYENKLFQAGKRLVALDALDMGVEVFVGRAMSKQGYINAALGNGVGKPFGLKAKSSDVKGLEGDVTYASSLSKLTSELRKKKEELKSMQEPEDSTAIEKIKGEITDLKTEIGDDIIKNKNSSEKALTVLDEETGLPTSVLIDSEITVEIEGEERPVTKVHMYDRFGNISLVRKEEAGGGGTAAEAAGGGAAAGGGGAAAGGGVAEGGGVAADLKKVRVHADPLSILPAGREKEILDAWKKHLLSLTEEGEGGSTDFEPLKEDFDILGGGSNKIDAGIQTKYEQAWKRFKAFEEFVQEHKAFKEVQAQSFSGMYPGVVGSLGFKLKPLPKKFTPDLDGYAWKSKEASSARTDIKHETEVGSTNDLQKDQLKGKQFIKHGEEVENWFNPQDLKGDFPLIVVVGGRLEEIVDIPNMVIFFSKYDLPINPRYVEEHPGLFSSLYPLWSAQESTKARYDAFKASLRGEVGGGAGGGAEAGGAAAAVEAGARGGAEAGELTLQERNKTLFDRVDKLENKEELVVEADAAAREAGEAVVTEKY